MIAIIRISGMVDVNKPVAEALHRLRLRRKYACVVLEPTPALMKQLIKLRNHVAYGNIDEKTLSELIDKRGQPIDKEEKLDASKIAKEFGKKSASDLGLKPFFRLHPPRGGIDSKIHFGVTPKAVLGDNKEKINDLIRRML